MASDCAALGVFSRLLVQDGSPPRTFSNTSERYGFLYESIQSRRIIQGRRRIVGTRDVYDGALRPHSYVIAGRLALQPGPADLRKWIPRILGGAFSGNTATTADELPTFDMLLDRENDVFLYTNCRVASAMFSGANHTGSEEEELVELVMTIVAETEVNGQTWPSPEPAVPNAAANAPYGNWEGVLTLGGSARLYDRFNLTIDNGIYVKARGSLTPNCIRAGDRSIRLVTSNPFTSVTHAQALTLWSAGAAGSLVFTNGGMSTSFSFPHLRNTYNTPNVGSKNEIPLELYLEAARTTGSNSVTVVNDDAP